MSGFTHSSCALIFNEFTSTKIKILNKNEIYVFHNTLKYYQKIERDQVSVLIENTIKYKIAEWHLYMTKDFKGEGEAAQAFKETILKHLDSGKYNIESTPYLRNVLEQVITKGTLTHEQIENLNYLPNYLNFKNYKVNLKTLEYEERTPYDFVTEILNYDFEPKSDKTIKKSILKIMRNICNDDDETLEFILSYFGYCITSETNAQKYLNAIGPGGNGKSTLVQMMEKVFDIYTYKCDNRQFSESFNKQHKYFIKMQKKRIVYVEEVDKKKANIGLLKDVVDGNKLEVEVLFGTTKEVEIDFKLLFFSNNIMNFDTDGGIRRRAIIIDFMNKFVDAEKFEEEKKVYKRGNVYIRDDNWLKNFENNDAYKLAFVHILLKYAKKYFTNGISVPAKFRETTDDIMDENDKFKNFLDQFFEITNDPKDRIHKNELHDMFNKYTNGNVAVASLFTEIKKNQLEYKKGEWAKYNGLSMRGCVVGIKKKTQEKPEPEFVEDEEEANPLDYIVGADNDKPNAEVKKLQGDLSMQRAKIIDLETANEKYKSRVEELEDELARMRKEIELLKASQTPSTTTPLSSNPAESESENEQPPKPKPKVMHNKQLSSLFFNLVAQAEEISVKKTKKDKKIEQTLEQSETNELEFIE
ncbi:MAG: DUF5906 domain-containing protein [Bacteroidota bacterium]